MIFDFFQLKKQLDAFTSGQARDQKQSISEMQLTSRCSTAI
jgi:hypothetical protein